MIMTNMLGQHVTMKSSRRKGVIRLIYQNGGSGIVFYIQFGDGSMETALIGSFLMESKFE